MSKPTNENRIAIRLPNDARKKLVKIAAKITPPGTAPNLSLAIRKLIESAKV